jgi:isopentenyldiphosphate isomerase
MADELIDILNDNLTVVKTCLKSEAHKNGWFHASVHIWFYTSKGEVLIQKRAKNKNTFPDLWDVSVAGHITSGEDVIVSAIREIKEEIGVSVTSIELTKIGVFKEKFKHREGFTDNEIHYIYLCQLITDFRTLRIQKEELSEIQLITMDTFENAIEKLSDTIILVPHYPDYYNFVLKNIKDAMDL